MDCRTQEIRPLLGHGDEVAGLHPATDRDTQENTLTQKIVRNVVLTPAVRHTPVIGHKAWTDKHMSHSYLHASGAF